VAVLLHKFGKEVGAGAPYSVCQNDQTMQLCTPACTSASSKVIEPTIYFWRGKGSQEYEDFFVRSN